MNYNNINSSKEMLPLLAVGSEDDGADHATKDMIEKERRQRRHGHQV